MGHRLLGLWKRRGPTVDRLAFDKALTGWFELRVDRIIGWATDGTGSRVDGMRIEAVRRGLVIASCPATPQPQHGRFAFSMPLEGVFTGADLVTERVTIVARDSDGNNGRLKLDGAAQLELIRDHLGVPCVGILDLDFSRDGNARPYLGAGWSGAEENYTWTEGNDSFIGFDTPAEPGTYALRFTAAALVRKHEPWEQLLAVFLNDEEIGRRSETEGHARFQEFKFQHEAFGGTPRATLRLHHPGAVRPSDVDGTRDTRRLAFAFKRLSVVRLLPVD
jgi:hypothetical protein